MCEASENISLVKLWKYWTITRAMPNKQVRVVNASSWIVGICLFLNCRNILALSNSPEKGGLCILGVKWSDFWYLFGYKLVNITERKKVKKLAKLTNVKPLTFTLRKGKSKGWQNRALWRLFPYKSFQSSTNSKRHQRTGRVLKLRHFCSFCRILSISSFISLFTHRWCRRRG